MIIAKHAVIGEHTDKFQPASHFHPAFFLKLAPQGQVRGLAALNPAARQEQAFGISVADQQDVAICILDHAADAKCHRARQAKPGPEQL